ncbi:MAG: hydantoinase B/oxoprolinase family protein, partial [Chloroflexi bacterium]|nr:hydantoinase B/oxoprolinase family protein [Chloroflexota bacterium]
GCGLQTDVRLIGPASAVARPALSGILNPARGLLGGHSGATASLTLNGAPIPALRTVPIECGDGVSVKTSGGGGFGDPFDREPALVLEDVIAGLVSLEQANASYGVVIDPATKSIGLQATRQTRALRRSRSDCLPTRDGLDP